VLHDFNLFGWPKTSGSRGMHIYVRLERRWDFDEVRRAALALAREVENRAPKLATSKWWKEERHGTWTRIRVNLQHVPAALRPTQEPLDPDEKILSNS
jgi:DNA primase